jgi:undecaprenyl-diphosphatase
MSIVQALILGIVQGATEFIPVSSSGHLVLVPWLLGWPEPGLVFDTIVHWGTLLAILAVFWRDLLALARAWARSLVERNPSGRALRLRSGQASGRSLDQTEARLAWLIIVGTLPAALMGFFLEDFFKSLFSSPGWVAALLLATGAILAVSERLGKRQRSLGDLGWLDSVLIGLAQGLAIAPGISRSGATIATGLLRGVKREAAARFSFLLATPIIFGAGLLQLLELFQAGTVGAWWQPLVVGFLVAAISGYLCIKFLLTYLQQGKLYVFAAYCWLAGIASLTVFLMRG